MPANPDSLVLRVVQVDALGNNPWDEPVDPTDDGFKIAAVYLVEPGKDDLLGAIWRDGVNLRFRDEANPGTASGGFTLTELLAGAGGGITAGQHRVLDQLVHDISEDSYEEISYTGNQVDSVVTWETSSKLKKIREQLFTYSGNKVVTIVAKQYDAAGALIAGETQTETLTYSGNKVASIDRVMS